MLHNKPLYLRHSFWAPAGDPDGGGGAETIDRGDDHVATDEQDHVKLKLKTEKDGLKKPDAKTDDKPKDEEEDKGKYDEVDDELETDEEKAEREAEEAKREREKRIRIPKSRYDEAQAKARQKIDALQKRIDELEGTSTAKAKDDQVRSFKNKIEELQDKYEDLVLDGKKAEAKAVRQQIGQMQDELSDYRAAVKSDEARTAAVDQMKFDVALARHEAAHPALNPDSEQFDEDLTGEVADLAESFIARGYNRAAALDKAVKYVMRGSEKADGKNEDTKEVIEKRRREEARKKAADAMKKQPADTTNIGKDSDKGGPKGKDDIDVMRMKQKDFVKLDEDTLSKLRGDVV